MNLLMDKLDEYSRVNVKKWINKLKSGDDNQLKRG
jgi:hypothetical protein